MEFQVPCPACGHKLSRHTDKPTRNLGCSRCGCALPTSERSAQSCAAHHALVEAWWAQRLVVAVPFQLGNQQIGHASVLRMKAAFDPSLDPSICWPWLRSTTRHGYGVLSLPGRKYVLAHRVSHAFFNGDFDQRLFVCHHCDNAGCVNPGHLFVGTHQDNMDDASHKGRLGGEAHRFSLYPEQIMKGETCHLHVLTEAEVMEIRAACGASPARGTYARLAASYSVTPENISAIHRRLTWKHI